MAEQALLERRWMEAAQFFARAWGEDTLGCIPDVQSVYDYSIHSELVIGSPVNRLDLTEQILLVTLFAWFAIHELPGESSVKFIASKKLHKLFGEFFRYKKIDATLIDEHHIFPSVYRPQYFTYSWFLSRKEVFCRELDVHRSKCWGSSFIVCQPFLEDHKARMQPSVRFIISRLRSCRSRKIYVIGKQRSTAEDHEKFSELLTEITLLGKSFTIIPYQLYIELDMLDVASILLGSEKVVTISSTLVFLAGFLGVPCEGLFNGLPMNALHGNGHGPSSFYPSVCYLNEVKI